MFEAKPENVAATATIVTMTAFSCVVKILYGISTNGETAASPFSVSSMVKTWETESEVGVLQKFVSYVPGIKTSLVRPMPDTSMEPPKCEVQTHNATPAICHS